MKHAAPAFTLIEVLFAAVAAAILLAGVYSVFHRAMKTRDSATEHIRQSRIRQRAVTMIRADLANAYISGGLMACTLEGSEDNQKSNFPGYLRFTASSGRDTNDEQGYGDVQQVEYYISGSAEGASTQNGPLVRVYTRDLLSSGTENPPEEIVLPRAESLDVAFFDGTNWQNSWELSGTTSSSGSTTLTSSGTSTTFTGGTTTLPRAIRLRIIQSPENNNASVPPPIEVFVPIEAEPFVTSGSTTTAGT